MIFLSKYVVFNIFYGKFLSSIDIDFLDYKFTSEFDDAMMFDTQYKAEKFASYIEEKVCVLKICSVF